MAKRGRPSLGKTVSIRVPEPIHLMMVWLAASRRQSVVRIAEELLADVTVDQYLRWLHRIKQIKQIEDQRDDLDNRPRTPLPEIRLFDANSGSSIYEGGLGVDPEELTHHQIEALRSVVNRQFCYIVNGLDPKVDEMYERNLNGWKPPKPTLDRPLTEAEEKERLESEEFRATYRECIRKLQELENQRKQVLDEMLQAELPEGHPLKRKKEKEVITPKKKPSTKK